MQLIEEEMVADNGLAVFTDEKAMKKLAKKNRTLLEKIHDFFNQFIDKLKAIKAKLSQSSAVYATINQDIDYLEQSADKIRTMLDDVQSQSEKQNVNTKYSKNTLDSEGNELTEQQQEYFKDSKVRDEDGNLLVVYHGTSEEFTVFDKTKGRANMDVQGMFFSPWELDAQGYGSNVKAYYLNITNPADEQTGYKALRKFQGQNNAGVKAREYLESLGYDGVNNENEEYIAFYSNQIKLTDNLNPTNKSDIRYSKDIDVDEFDESNYNVINTTGLKRYAELKSEVMTWDNTRYPNQVRCIELSSKGFYMYKMLDNDTKDIVVFKPKTTYARRQYNEIRRSYRRRFNGSSVYVSEILKDIRNGSYDNSNISRNEQEQLNNFFKNSSGSIRRERNGNGRGRLEADDNDNLSEELDKQSRNTRLTLDDNIEDVNEAFLSAVKVLQNVHIDDIDLSSEVVNKAEKAAKHIQKRLPHTETHRQRLCALHSNRIIGKIR